MLGNVNKNLKKNILEQFRQEAINYEEKKKYEKLKKIQEEKEYLLKQEQLYNKDEELINKEKHKKKEQEFNEYNLMLTKLHSKTPIYRYNSNPNSNIKRPIIKFNVNEIENNKSLLKREKEIIYRRDIIGKYLTDENNTEELFKDLRREKEKSQRYYREINDLQYLEYQKKNKKLFGTVDPLIVKRAKKKILTENPFSHKIKYDFWKSNLSYNPILNPENNVHYNRYLFQEEVDCNNYNNMIMNEKNKNNNKNYRSIDTNFQKNHIKIKLPKNNNNYNNDNFNEQDKKIINIDINNNNKFNEEITNNHYIESNTNLSNTKYEMDLKKKFFNINYDYYKINNNYNKKEEKINYNNDSYRPKICKRKILRQAISSSFLH